jgi:hypothetical protein
LAKQNVKIVQPELILRKNLHFVQLVLPEHILLKLNLLNVILVQLEAFQLVDQLIVLYVHQEHILQKVQAHALILKQDIIPQPILQNLIFVLLDIIPW